MQPEERDLAYLWDMREAARKIARFIAGARYHRFSRDELMQSAVERQLEIIGEAARRVSPQFRQAHPEIPWRNIIGLRNLLIHEYGEVRVDRIWLIITTSVPDLEAGLNPLIPPITDEDTSQP